MGLCVGLLIVMSVAYFGGTLNRDYKISAAQQKCGDLYECDDNNRPIDRFGELLSEEAIRQIEASDNPENPNYYERQDLRAQESMALATDRLVAISIASLVIGFIGAAVVIVTLRSAVDANAIATKHFEADQRPLVRFDGSAHVSYLHVEPDHRSIVVGIPVVNSGKSAATEAVLHIEAAKRPLRLIGNGRSRKFGERVLSSRNPHVGPTIIFPNAEPAEIVGTTYSIPDERPLQLLICVVYQGRSSDRRYYTAQMLSLGDVPADDGEGIDGVEQTDVFSTIVADSLAMT